MKNVVASILLLFSLSALADDRCDGITELAVHAALDDPRSAYDLGVAFYTGRCTAIPKSYENAAKMWRRASDLGVIPAKNNLGYLLYTGLAGREDKAEAVRLWAEAAKVGFAKSQTHLGIAYFDGAGIGKDQARGLAWVLLAIDSAPKRPDTADGGGGQAVLADALEEKERMLKVAPQLIETAQALKAELSVNER
ncbi:tetratricopeptide repeat protein [Lysobacter niastensis]|uniref:Sel1 repeat family protein n=1 Tax=Lysobacter niastensis TaxID=380629 RepID=A0ABS0B4K5_9GAMM|nr:tetratricopeptide repeat protein [Lysobacter niastensis]MBF6023423.1 sel1 repeat family protein [Lysobacter niastensis]